jgi:hypothetical protein
MWQPIETAPKDGTDVMLADAESRETVVAFWRLGWIVRGRGIFDYPTHWMPIPELPPTQEK